MVFKHLYRLHVILRQIICRKSVLAADEVVPIDIEFVDGLPVIHDCAVVVHLYTRQTLYDIDYGVILLLGKLVDIVDQRIAFLIYVGSLYYNIAELCCLGRHLHRRKVVGHLHRQSFVAHAAECHAHTALDIQRKRPVGLGR